MQNAILKAQVTSPEHLRRFAEGGFLFAILDADVAPCALAKAKELGQSSAVPLTTDDAGEPAGQVIAYLLAVAPAVLDWILANLPGTAWGIFIFSKASLDKLVQHFRCFLIVQLPDGEKWLFRFYDPRILRIYLLHCTEGELRNFFGPARGFAIPEERDVLWLVEAPPPLPGKGDTDPGFSFLWQIREEQSQAFSRAEQRSKEDRLLAHLGRLFPEQCQSLGEEEMRRVVQYGLQRAASYQIVAEEDLCKYLDLMFGFGRDFDSDARYPWALATLKDPARPDASVRINDLFDLFLDYARNAEADASKAP